MGQTLSEPVTTKITTSCSNKRYLVGSSSMQGWRINMEDAHTHILELPENPEAAFFGVFDGHGNIFQQIRIIFSLGGAKIARYASENLLKMITQTRAYLDGRIPDALIDGFLALDEQMLGTEELKEEMSGSTAVVLLVKDNCLFCANAGDSRAVASLSGKAMPLSKDHKPGNEEETQRILAAGGWVEFNRVNGNLALSRALGDFAFKRNDDKTAREQIVTACPEVEAFALTPEHEFVVIACDGIWDVMSNQDVVDFCRRRLAQEIPPNKVCEELLDKCLAPDCELSGLGCDNMTVVLVCLLQERKSEEFLMHLKKRSEDIRPKPTETQPSEHLGDYRSKPKENQPSEQNIPNKLEECNDIYMYQMNEDVFSTPSQSPPLLTARTGSIEEKASGSVDDTSEEEEMAPPSQFKVLLTSEGTEIEVQRPETSVDQKIGTQLVDEPKVDEGQNLSTGICENTIT